MYQKERLDRIMELLERHGYLTVQYLTEQLHYSAATVNRDLHMLEQMQKIRRSYGGAEPVKSAPVPLPFRYEKQKLVKKRIAKRAAELVREGDVIFVDGTTTTQYLAEYLIEKKNLTVLTNNMALASFVSEYGIHTVVLGGTVIEAPYMLGGPDAVESAMHYYANKCFFSTGIVTPDGEIGIGYMVDTFLRTIISRSEQAFLLVDAEKISRRYPTRTPCNFSRIHGVISDYSFDAEVRARFPDTTFLTVE